MPLDKSILELRVNAEEQQSPQPKLVTFIHCFLLTTTRKQSLCDATREKWLRELLPQLFI